ncbi:MAG TPA: hypothetical protein PLS84_07485, partial [Salinivirgaceae bacterium]|nr:hypothetical protein [Salinivirgaceae bacterium]
LFLLLFLVCTMFLPLNANRDLHAYNRYFQIKNQKSIGLFVINRIYEVKAIVLFVILLCGWWTRFQSKRLWNPKKNTCFLGHTTF